MKAEVTIKLTPAEFDVLRRAVSWHESNQMTTAEDRSTDMKMRADARAEAVLAAALLDKLT